MARNCFDESVREAPDTKKLGSDFGVSHAEAFLFDLLQGTPTHFGFRAAFSPFVAARKEQHDLTNVS